jgi:hypothetical protein
MVGVWGDFEVLPEEVDEGVLESGVVFFEFLAHVVFVEGVEFLGVCF